ncbi:MAG: DMT family transporter [Candidatus Berkelbacteria bacterium]|nr:DMT family transporter [Candidatus Berkelbacteria bacterium]
MIESFIAAIGYAGGVVVDKVVLSRYKIPVKRFVPLLFLWLAVITAFLLPKFGVVNWQLLFTTKYILLFLAMIIVAITWNSFYYRGIQSEEIHNFEMVMLLAPLFTIVFSEIFLPNERNLPLFIAGGIASIVLVASRFRHHHLQISRNTGVIVLAMLLMSLESIIIKMLLGVFSPASLYFARTSVMAIIFLIFWRPKLLAMPARCFAYIILSAAFGVVQMVLKFYGFARLGVVETTIILVLGPLLVYFFSAFYFKENLKKRDIIASAIIIATVVWVSFFR